MKSVKPSRIKTVGILVNPRKEEVCARLEELDSWIERSKHRCSLLLCTYNSEFIKTPFRHIVNTTESDLLKTSDIILTLGGDGTILRAVHSSAKYAIPILGINLGGLGFLADTSPENMITNLESCLEGHYFIEKRSLLKCHIKKDHYSFEAFNDIVIDKSGFSRVIEIITHVNNSLLNSYIADGLILSTPTGSTAYSLSAGGPIVMPETNVFLINPICPHSLTNRPVVVADDCRIRLDVFTEYKEINIYRDGQIVRSYPSGTSFEITKADYSVKLVKMKEMSFYDTLRNKLHWGEDFRDKKRWTFDNQLK